MQMIPAQPAGKQKATPGPIYNKYAGVCKYAYQPSVANLGSEFLWPNINTDGNIGNCVKIKCNPSLTMSVCKIRDDIKTYLPKGRIICCSGNCTI